MGHTAHPPSGLAGLPSYEEESLVKQRAALQLACQLAAPLLLSFTLLDRYLVEPGRWGAVLAVRLAGAGGLLALARGLSRPGRRVLAWAGPALAAAVVPIAVAAAASGGLRSPYLFATLVPLGALSALVPLAVRQLAWLHLELVALALLPFLGQAGAEPLAFAVVGSFLASMSMVGLAGAAVGERLRQQEYRARAEASRQTGLAQLGQVAGGLAHELSQPLASVSLELAALSERGAPGLPPRSLDRLSRGVDRMRQILSAMRQGARVPDGRMRGVNLGAQLELALTLVEPQLLGLQVQRELEPVPEVQGQPTLLGQVLVNLLVNAAHALRGRPGGQVVVRLRRQGTLAVAEVEDNGPGVPEAMRERIFEPFFTTKGEEGNGLGLWISSEIARTHGGSLSVHRGAAGGALFRLELPLAPASPRRQQTPSTLESWH